jgi:hypothetical protein
MATRAQIDRLTQRIEALAARRMPSETPPEAWVVDGDRAYRQSAPGQIITAAELGARPTDRAEFPTRIVRVIVDSAHSEERP